MGLRPERFLLDEMLAGLARWLRPGGVFGMWSDALPEAPFTAALQAVFTEVEAKVVAFDNPLGGDKADCTIYLARAR